VSTPPYTLAIETSNPTAGPRGAVTVIEGRSVLAGPGVALGRLPPQSSHSGVLELVDEEPLRENEGGSDDLVGAIDRLCRRAGVRPRDIARVAVSIGPGGYTALRTAIAAAKMIAEATGAETIPVASAGVAAWCVSAGPPALVCLASKAETTHATLLPAGTRSGTWWETTGRGAVGPLLESGAAARLEEVLARGQEWIAASCPIGVIGAEQVEAIRPGILIADRFLPESIRAVGARIGARIVEPIFAASSVLAISARTPPVDVLRLAPVYPREPDAVTQWRRKNKANPAS
jgi:tRNA N6-adenosine threonylcarbamoyltransferase